jgi:hypothetical protein
VDALKRTHGRYFEDSHVMYHRAKRAVSASKAERISD